NLLLVQLLVEARVGEEALNLRAKEEGLPIVIVVEGLNAEDVPGAEELLLLLVPDDKGEHAPQLLQNALAVLLVPVEDGLRIGAGGELVSLLQQVLPQSLEIVDFPVEHQHLG